MSFDGIAEQEAILTRAQTLMSGRFYDGIPDEDSLERDDTTGLVLPYGVVSFGELYDVGSNDRSLAGEDQQPAIMPVTFNLWGPSSSDVRRTSGATRVLFRGWAANQNMSPMTFRGGGSFLNRDSTGVPSRFLRSVTMETIINYSLIL